MSTKTKKKTTTTDKKKKTSTDKKTKEDSSSSSSSAPSAPSAPSSTSIPSYNPYNLNDFSPESFQAGQLFSYFDQDRDGQLNKYEFTELVRKNPELFNQLLNNNNKNNNINDEYNSLNQLINNINNTEPYINNNNSLPKSIHFHTIPYQSSSSSSSNMNPGISSSSSSSSSSTTLPLEISGIRLLTHYDETYGIPLPSIEAKIQQKNGHIVLPLYESYYKRYKNLRQLILNKLLPKREYLIQKKNIINDKLLLIINKKKKIINETINDYEKILIRLNNYINNINNKYNRDINIINDELEIIENYVIKVEQANINGNGGNQYITNLTSSSSSGTTTNTTTNNTSIPSSTPIPSSNIHSTSSIFATIPNKLNDLNRLPSPALMLEVIQSYSNLVSSINNYSNKPIELITSNNKIDQGLITTDNNNNNNDDDDLNFPREIHERLEIISRCDRYVKALQVKDHMLYEFNEKKIELEKKLMELEKLNNNYMEEISNWVNLAQELHIKNENNEKNINILKKQNEDLKKKLREFNVIIE